MDLTKAFNKVNHNALLIKLMNRKLPGQLLFTLEQLLSICWSCVKWYSSMSVFFKINYGLRQGSVLSPHLFAVYLDDLVVNHTLRNKMCITLCRRYFVDSFFTQRVAEIVVYVRK